MPKVGVFGANGFIGRAIIRSLLSQGRNVVAFGRAFSRDFESKVGGRVEARVVDFNETLSTHASLQGIDQVINLVNSSSPALGNGRVEEDLLNNALPHIAFTQSCLLSGVSRIIFVSSGGTVYGEPRYLPVDEGHMTSPIVSYGMTKLIVEQYMRMLTRGTDMSYIILRVSNPFGPGQMMRKGQGLIASILERHAQSAPISIFGDGQTQRDYIYIDDLCEALTAALDAPSMQETFNIGTGIGRSVLDVVTAIEAHIGQQLTKEFLPARNTDAKSNVLDCRKAGSMLGWTARTPFDEAIRRTVAEYD